jgi:hypothetical protein
MRPILNENRKRRPARLVATAQGRQCWLLPSFMTSLFKSTVCELSFFGQIIEGRFQGRARLLFHRRLPQSFSAPRFIARRYIAHNSPISAPPARLSPATEADGAAETLFGGADSFWPRAGGLQALAAALRRRHQPRRPPQARIRPGIPAPTIGPGTSRNDIVSAKLWPVKLP